jgi:L-alanine-DL-glutamate epimerase-like enolase superfamily enzyme
MRLRYVVHELSLSEAFSTSRGTRTSSAQVFIELEDGQHIGFGACVPEDHKGYSLRRICLELDKLQRRVDFSSLSLAIEELISTGTSVITEDLCRNSLSGVVMAALDLRAKQFNCSLSRLMDSSLEEIRSFKTVTLADLSMVDLILERYQHWVGIKIKAGPQFDLAPVTRLRERYSGLIIVDANGSWDLPQAINYVQQLEALKVDIVEEPISHSHAQLRDECQLNYMRWFADESCNSVADINKLANVIDGVVLKQNKSGGLLSVQEQLQYAKSLSLGVILGCKVESQIGIAACVQLAQPGVYFDLDGHCYLRDDIFVGLQTDERTGSIVVNKAAGIGVHTVE